MSCSLCNKKHCESAICTCKCFWCMSNLRQLDSCIYCYTDHKNAPENCTCGCVLCHVCDVECKCRDDICICGDGSDICIGCAENHHCLGMDCDISERIKRKCDCAIRGIPTCICNLRRFPLVCNPN